MEAPEDAGATFEIPDFEEDNENTVPAENPADVPVETTEDVPVETTADVPVEPVVEPVKGKTFPLTNGLLKRVLNLPLKRRKPPATSEPESPVLKIPLIEPIPVIEEPIEQDIEEEELAAEILVVEPAVVSEPKPQRKRPQILVEEPEPSPEPEIKQEKENSPTMDVGSKVEKITIKDRLKLVLTTRKVKKKEETPPEMATPKPKKRSYVERKFSPAPVQEVKKPVGTNGVSEEVESLFEDPLPDPVVEEIRRKPLPPVKMIPKETFWIKLKNLGPVLKIASKFSSKKEKKRVKKTGLTSRQRIKRYNAVHEGGYGITEEPNEEAL